MSELRGKILLVVASIIAVLTIAGAALGGFMLGDTLQQTTGQMLVAYDWNTIKIVITIALAVIAALLSVPGVITARQVSRMYNVGRKYARWSAGTIFAGVVMLLVTAAAIFGICYEINEMKVLLQALLEMDNIVLVQIAAAVATLFVCVTMFMPLLLSLRVRDSVSALNRKKHNRNYDED